MPRLTDEQREHILADFNIGKSQNELAKKYEVSPATINKLCKGVEPKHLDKVNALTRINTELVGESEYQVNAIHKEVDERTKHIQFFTGAAIQNVQEAMTGHCENQNDYRARADTILKGRETVIGKTPDTAIQINNTVTSPRELTDDDLAHIASSGSSRATQQAQG
jgi:transcriptional regulator with XRE-family HTH domain